eukprot:GFYU01024090.1.p1 GENE.GFYU01024090.1~~GFYU01024090.1.p1  ORF type:complete len:138 (-),score=39.90 GFYU01024090.1:72-464(-)
MFVKPTTTGRTVNAFVAVGKYPKSLFDFTSYKQIDANGATVTVPSSQVSSNEPVYLFVHTNDNAAQFQVKLADESSSASKVNPAGFEYTTYALAAIAGVLFVAVLVLVAKQRGQRNEPLASQTDRVLLQA